MPSIGSILNSARTALFVNQAAVRVASDNISNAQTEGYSRKRAIVRPGPIDRTPIGYFGTGARIDDVVRVRDTLLDRSFRRETTRTNGFEMRENLLSGIEQIFGEPSELGLDAAMDAFWKSWSDFANQPASDTAMKLVRQAGGRVAGLLQDYSKRLDEALESNRLRLVTMVESVNNTADQIASLNRGIVAAAAGGQTPADLLDQRDRLVDQLASLGTVQTVQRGNGSLAIIFDGVPLVDGVDAKRLQITPGLTPTIVNGSTTLPFDEASGPLGQAVRFIQVEAPNVQARLDDLAASLISRVNAVHTTGYNAAGTTGIEFFDSNPAFANAHDIRLSAAVLADHTNIVASSQTAPNSDNLVALQLVGLRDDASTMASGTMTFSAYYRDVVAEVAVKVQSARDNAVVYKHIASQVDTRRQSISGVSTDEELIKLNAHQQSYVAATKLVSAVQDMMDSILNMV